MDCNECLFEDDSAAYEMMARREAERIECLGRRRYRLALRLRKAAVVLLVALVAFLLPGIVVCYIAGKGGLDDVMACSVVSSLFCHPVQLLAIDWACNRSGGCRPGHRT